MPDLPADTQVRSFVASVSHYVKAHEILLIAVLGVAAVWFVSGKVGDVIARHDQNTLVLAQADLKAQAEKNAALAQQVAEQAKFVAAQKVETDRLNQSLEQANAALINALAQRQQIDRQLPPMELAQRIELLATLPPQSVVPQPDNSFKVGQPAAVELAVTLEKVPVLQKELDNAQQEKLNTGKLLAATETQVGTLNARVDGLNLQISKADTVCKDQVKVERDKAAKAKRRWFIIGFISGFLTRSAIPVPTH